MTLEVAVAAQSDADRIADIHMAAFGTNALLRAQFPTPAIRDQLRECIAQKAADDIRDPNIAVLVVRDEGQMVSFAKWSLPVFELGTYMETPWIWPEGTNFPILSEWTEKAEAAQQKVLGELPSYRLDNSCTYVGCNSSTALLALLRSSLAFGRRVSSSVDVVELGMAHLDPGLTFIGTDPLHERRGAATSLIRWGLDRCAKNKIPAYLESTLSAAPIYEKLGFKTAERLSIVLEGPVIYEEACCLYEPNDDIFGMKAPSDTAT